MIICAERLWLGGDHHQSIRVAVDRPESLCRVTLVKNAISAAKDAGVNFLLIISSTTVGLATTIMGQPFSQIEAEIRAVDIPYSTIRCKFRYLLGTCRLRCYF